MSARAWLVAVLLAAVWVSALGVVYVKHLERKRFLELQALEHARDAMQVEWGKLQLEQSTWTTHDRIEGIARNKLDMYLPPADSVVVVTP